ncbi:hypothetical protein CKAH01_14415 [Colletotrichum kahawae]|uniref:Clr5 domain-containing protein n=1 Tax=Colletotrichum kahawae TaxID=34407 RepID=A0AAE0D9Q0_COLKA|nr:hypothetical protein CKAH01_14415 [Colletotrichum kahawae]
MTKDWRSLRADVHQLYCEENRKLRDVMKIIEARHGFKASERSYHNQLRKWGYMKYKLHDGQRSSDKARSPSLARSSTATGDEAPRGLLPAVSSSAMETSFSSTTSAPTLSCPATLSSHVYSNGPTGLPAPSSVISFPEVVARQLSPSAGDPLPSPYRADGKTDLHLAVLAEVAQDNMKVKVEQVLRRDSSRVNVKDAQGNGALHYATERSFAEIVALLLDHGATVDAKGGFGKTPLHLAASHDFSLVLLLLRRRADATAKDADGNTPAHIAVQHSKPEMGESNTLHALIDHERSTLNTPNRWGFTPFHYILKQHRLALDFFLSRGASATMPFPNGQMPLEMLLKNLGPLKDWVACRGWTEIVCLMIELGANPDTLLPSGKSLTVEYFEILPSMGQEACFDIALGQTLCNFADLIAPSSNDGPEASLLHVLSKNCIKDTAPTLSLYSLFQTVLDRGGDPNMKDEKGRTPLLLLLSYEQNNKDAVLSHLEQLVLYGANPWISDKDGKNAILAAAKSPEYSEACLNYLLRNSLEAQKSMHQRLYRRSVFQHCRLQEWLSAVDADGWSEAKRWLHDLRAPENLKMCAFKIIAEWYLENSKSWFEDAIDRKERRRRYNARIIRDCHHQDIRLGPEYYDNLVRLCL